MKFCVIGLGRFGYQIATGLAEHGMEVLAIDSNEAIVASIRDIVTQAVCMRITDETSLQSVGVDEIETVIVATGENFAQSILLTALLKKRLTVQKVIARGINDIHKEILMLIGADQVILPEKEIGIRLADILSSPFLEQRRLTPDYSVTQIKAPKSFVGKKVGDLMLVEKHQVNCFAIKKGDEIITIDNNYVVAKDDKLICAGNNETLEEVAGL